ncbi:tyrosine-type recombinase/integrase [Pseudoalteromonas piscicida]|uniref:tyrosine-type recombinase/integrase n=1 Tax=Pseudoalteromonas piscicida TaxID=43662 RepID=UPI001FD3644B|nr:tyrosine-type recombinase/integrase [Pseudoalteromonas piscicida]
MQGNPISTAKKKNVGGIEKPRTRALWQEFDFDKMTWTIPAERVKQNKGGERIHKVPITQNMIIILDELRASFSYLCSKYVFPSTSGTTSAVGEQPIDRHSLSRVLNRKQKELGVPKFVPHDLRRTMATKQTTIIFLWELTGINRRNRL